MHDARNPRPTSSITWWVRNRLTARGRQRARRVADFALRPIGSINGVLTDQRIVALTFDDGPDPAMTPVVLDALQGAQMRATFFVLADRALDAPKVLQRIVSEGHEVALHGTDHRRVTGQSVQAVTHQLRMARSLIEPIIQAPIRYYRPPFGAQSVRSYIGAHRAGLAVVVWSQECDDWLPLTENDVAQRAVTRAAPGNIVLLHDGLVPDPDRPTPPTTLDRGAMVSATTAALAARGFRGVTVSELLTRHRARTTAWFRP